MHGADAGRGREAVACLQRRLRYYCRVKTLVFENFLPSALVPSATIVLVLPSFEIVVFEVEITDPSRFIVATA
jgi:hypothetical protein